MNETVQGPSEDRAEAERIVAAGRLADRLIESNSAPAMIQRLVADGSAWELDELLSLLDDLADLGILGDAGPREASSGDLAEHYLDQLIGRASLHPTRPECPPGCIGRYAAGSIERAASAAPSLLVGALRAAIHRLASHGPAGPPAAVAPTPINPPQGMDGFGGSRGAGEDVRLVGVGLSVPQQRADPR